MTCDVLTCDARTSSHGRMHLIAETAFRLLSGRFLAQSYVYVTASLDKGGHSA